MQNELDNQLFDKYPKIFRNPHAGADSLCLCRCTDDAPGSERRCQRICHQVQPER